MCRARNLAVFFRQCQIFKWQRVYISKHLLGLRRGKHAAKVGSEPAPRIDPPPIRVSRRGAAGDRRA